MLQNISNSIVKVYSIVELRISIIYYNPDFNNSR